MRRVLKALWAGWKMFAHALGVVNRFLLLTIFYCVFVNVVHGVLWMFRVDLLDRRMRPAPSYWRERAERPDLYQHQF
jgi:hypothetical protein